MSINVDTEGNRAAQKWTRAEQFGRILWALVLPLFKMSPRVLWFWRNWLLRCFGARIGREVQIYPSVRVTIPWNISIADFSAVGDGVILYALGEISIGNRTTISQGVHLCAGTHDWRDPAMPLQKLPLSIGDRVWVCADAFVGPGVVVGNDSIVGARAVVMRDLPENVIAVGHPARIVSSRYGGNE